MPCLSALYKHPIKSCAGHAVQELVIGPRGPVGDREFMVTDERYVFLTQRKEQGGLTRMALIYPQLTKMLYGWQWMILYAYDTSVMPCPFPVRVSTDTPVRVTIHDDICDAIDQGDEAAKWLSTFLGMPCRLVRMTDTFYRRVNLVFSPETAQASFADAYPVLLISDASLADLNARLEKQGKPPVSRENFRSCLWAGDCEPYEEDTWEQIQIKGVVFDVVKPCQRCSITQVDWQRGVYRDDKEPLITLRTYRHQTIEKTGKSGVMFGQNLVHRNTGAIHIGDKIRVLRYKPANWRQNLHRLRLLLARAIWRS